MTHMIPFVTNVCFPSILEIHKCMLKTSITLRRQEVPPFSMGNYKSLEPDGYHPIFLKGRWNNLGPPIDKLIL